VKSKAFFFSLIICLVMTDLIVVQPLSILSRNEVRADPKQPYMSSASDMTVLKLGSLQKGFLPFIKG
jgi:hypothetical protein